MRKFWLPAVGLLLSLLLAIPATAQNVQNFVINSFEADYYLSRNQQKTSLLRVEEKIVAEFTNFDQNHGILRAIPERYQDHTLSLQINSVKKDDGSPWHFTTYKENDNLVLKIGDSDRFVHGQQTYLISYTMRNVINFQTGRDEFYWDVNGDQWPQTIISSQARIHIPIELQTGLQDRQACYAGFFGSTGQTCKISRTVLPNETLITAKTAEALAPYQTLTFAIGINSGTFSLGPEVAHEQLIKRLKNVLSGVLLVSAPSLAFGVMLNRWRKFGDDPKGRGVIIPQYQPPENLDSLSADFIFKGQLRTQAISAALIEQATAKHLTIYEITKQGLFGKKDYELELNSLAPGIRDETKDVLKAVFGQLEPGTKVKVSDFKKQTAKTDLYETIQKTGSQLAENLYQAGYYVKNPNKIRSSYQAWSIVPFLIGIGLLFVPWGDFYPLIWLAVGLMLASLTIFLFAFIMPARSLKGVEVHDYMLGLKDYIKLAEADRLKFLQSAEGAEKITDPAGFDPKTNAAKIKLFESLLSYAMLFGLEKSWAKQFEGLYTKPPDWYRGNWTAFNIGYLSGSLGDFAKASSVSFSPPSSSSGSGFSGGAGGGGGGGGGGGW